MTRVLLVGLQPETVDYSDPALPPDMDAKKIQAGIEQGLKKITDRGWQADTCLSNPTQQQVQLWSGGWAPRHTIALSSGPEFAFRPKTFFCSRPS